MTDQPRPRVLTGLRANDNLTIANYLGALHPMAELVKKHKDTHDFFMFVPDLHSFTTPINHEDLYQNTINNVRIFVAAGAVDLKSTNLHVYRQSQVPAHSELTWILDCFAYMGELSRMTQFKEKAGLSLDEEQEAQLMQSLIRRVRQVKNKVLETIFEHDLKKMMQGLKHASITAGLFNYPVLMASDILLYSAKYVPLGDDQRQHLELTRDLALRLNEKFKDVFPEGVFEQVPAPWKEQLKFSSRDRGLRIRSLRVPQKKMSKSDTDATGYISLTDSPAAAAKKIMSATTDSLGSIHFNWDQQPGVTNLIQILAMLTERDIHEVITEWQGKSSYGDLKGATAKAVSDFLTGFQKRLASVDEAKLVARIEADEAKAREIAGTQLLRVQQAVGLRPRP